MKEETAKAIADAAKALSVANYNLIEAVKSESHARNVVCDCKNKVNEAAKRMDVLIQQSKKEMSPGTDWSTK